MLVECILGCLGLCGGCLCIRGCLCSLRCGEGRLVLFANPVKCTFEIKVAVIAVVDIFAFAFLGLAENFRRDIGVVG